MPAHRQFLLGAGCAALAGLAKGSTAHAGSAGQSRIDIRSRHGRGRARRPLLFDYRSLRI